MKSTLWIRIINNSLNKLSWRISNIVSSLVTDTYTCDIGFYSYISIIELNRMVNKAFCMNELRILWWLKWKVMLKNLNSCVAVHWIDKCGIVIRSQYRNLYRTSENIKRLAFITFQLHCELRTWCQTHCVLHFELLSTRHCCNFI